jgi:hypothetical protein
MREKWKTSKGSSNMWNNISTCVMLAIIAVMSYDKSTGAFNVDAMTLLLPMIQNMANIGYHMNKNA